MNLELNYEGFENYLLHRETHAMMHGVQYLFRFENDYGASVIKHDGSYGHREDLWELAVLWFSGPCINDRGICYTTPITDDVIGWQTDKEIRDLLQRIKELEKTTL